MGQLQEVNISVSELNKKQPKMEVESLLAIK